MKTSFLLVLGVALCGLSTCVDCVAAQDWTSTSAPSNHWTSIACSADGAKLLAAGLGPAYGSGAIYTSTNSGVTWASNSAPLAAWQAAASSADGVKLVAV